MLSTNVIRDTSGLHALREAWEGLVARSADNELAMHPLWILPWWATYGSDSLRSLRCLAFTEQERLVGFVPLVRRPYLHTPGIPFRRLEIVGSGEAEKDETCSDYLGLVAEKGREREVVEAFARALASGAIGGWDELVIHSMNGESPLPALLEERFRARGYNVALDVWSSAPYVPLPSTWDDYVKTLTRSHRGLLRRALRTFEEWAGGPPTITRVRTADELAEGKRRLIALHGARWTGGGAFASSKFTAFHDRIMPALLARGALDLGWLSARGEPVAAYYNFRHAGRVYHYQSGRRLDVPANLSIGVTMQGCLIRAAIEDGMREYDFLAGDALYKRTLALAARPLVTLRVARHSLRELARGKAVLGIDKARRVRAHAKVALLPRLPPHLKALLEMRRRST